MKILNIHDYPPTEGGGVEVNVSRVGSALVQKGIQYRILTSRKISSVIKSNSSQSEFSKDGVEIKIINSLSELNDEIINADIVNVHLTFSLRTLTMMAIELCAQLNKKTIVSLRTTFKHIPFSALGGLTSIEKEYQLNKLTKLLSQDNFVLAAPSVYLKETLSFLGLNKQLNVVHNGISIVNNATSDKESTISVVDFTYIGNLSVLKNVEGLLEAFAKLNKLIPNTKLRLIGNGELMNEVLQKIEYFELASSVEVLGYVENRYISDYLKSTKVLIHPSLTEAWCNSVAEALSIGIPVIASGVEGLRELTQEGSFADLVIPGDTESLFLSMKEILESKTKYLHLKSKADKAKDFVLSNYTIENQADQLIKLYKSLL